MEKIRYFALIFIVTRVALPVTCQTTNESIDSTTASTLTTTSQVTTESTSVTTIAVTTTEAGAGTPVISPEEKAVGSTLETDPVPPTTSLSQSAGLEGTKMQELVSSTVSGWSGDTNVPFSGHSDITATPTSVGSSNKPDPAVSTTEASTIKETSTYVPSFLSDASTKIQVPSFSTSANEKSTSSAEESSSPNTGHSWSDRTGNAHGGETEPVSSFTGMHESERTTSSFTVSAAESSEEETTPVMQNISASTSVRSNSNEATSPTQQTVTSGKISTGTDPTSSTIAPTKEETIVQDITDPTATFPPGNENSTMISATMSSSIIESGQNSNDPTASAITVTAPAMSVSNQTHALPTTIKRESSNETSNSGFSTQATEFETVTSGYNTSMDKSTAVPVHTTTLQLSSSGWPGGPSSGSPENGTETTALYTTLQDGTHDGNFTPTMETSNRISVLLTTTVSFNQSTQSFNVSTSTPNDIGNANTTVTSTSKVTDSNISTIISTTDIERNLTTYSIETTVAPPSAPTGLNIASKTTKSLEVTWQIAIETIDSYIVQFKLKDASDSTFNVSHANLSSSATSANITGLLPGQYYTVQVIATRGQLNSSAAEINGPTAPAPPNRVDVNGETTSTVVVTWVPGSGSYSGFKLEYAPVDPLNEAANQSVETNRTTYTLGNLTAGTNYSISVKTLLNRMESTPSTTAAVTYPKPVERVWFNLTTITRYKITLGWDFPGGIVSSYKVWFRGVGKNETILVNRLNNIAEATDLYPGRNYTFVVISESRGKSTLGKEFVQNSRPVPPTFMRRKEPFLPRSATVKIGLPNSSDFNGFKLLDVKQNRTLWFIEVDSSSPINEFDVENLMPGTMYSVKASTVSGNLESEPTENADQLWTVPLPPSNLTVKNIQETEVTLVWEKPDGGVEKYMISYGNHPLIHINDEDSTSKTLDTLYPGRKYTFSMQTSAVGEHSSPTYVTCRTVPLGVTITNNSSNTTWITLQWYQPESEFDKYLIEFLTKEITVDDNNTRSVSLGNFTPGTEYNFSIFTQSGSGEYIQKSKGTMVTVRTTPDTVKSITFPTIGTNGAVVQFQKSDTGVFDGHSVTVSPNDGTVGNIYTSDNVGFMVNVTGLTPGKAYVVTVITLSGNLSSEPFSEGFTTNETAPGSPSSLDATSLASRTITLQWESPVEPNGIILKYIIQYNQTSGRWKNNVTEKETTDNSTSYHLEGLEPGSNYDIVVFAQNSAGRGAPSNVLQKTTNEETPGSPSSLNATSLASRTITLQWESPVEPNGIILGYIIQYNQTSGRWKSNVTEKVTTDNNTSYHLEGLEPGSNYDIVVFAKNTAGRGAPSNVLQKTTNEETPGNPYSLNATTLASRSIMLQWEPPLYPNGIILRYIIQYNQTSGRWKNNVTELVTADNNTSYVITGLEPGSSYGIIVIAENSAGPGVSSDVLQTTTIEGRSGNVTNLQVVVASSKVLNVTWGYPDVPNGVISHYIIKLIKNGTCMSGFVFNCSNCMPPSGNQSLVIDTLRAECKGSVSFERQFDSEKGVTYQIENLKPYTNYTVEVYAVNSQGLGTVQSQIEQTDEARPSAPQHIAFGDISPTSIEVQWQDPVMKRGILVDYLIIVTKASNGEVVKNETQDANEAKSFNATGLDPCRNYTFKVAARTSKGFGNYSSEQTNSTAVNIPGTPVIVKAEAKTSTSILVMWTPPPNETCPIDYMVEMTDSDRQNSVKELIKGYQSTEKNITGLKKYWSYDIKVRANTTAGPSMPSPLITKRTLEDKPGPPARVNASCDVCYNSMTVTWEAPTRENKNGIITGYVIYYTDGKISKNKKIDIGSQKSSTITSLSAEKSYQVKVAARTRVGEGEKETAPTYVNLTSGPPIFIDTLGNTFAEVSTASVKDARKQISLQVARSPFGSENGIVRNISVIVAEDSEAGKPESDVRKDSKFPTLKTWGQVKDLEKITPYAIKEVEPNPWGTTGRRKRRAATQYKIIIGSEDCSNVATSKYCNGPLPSGRTYCIRIRGYTTNGYTDTPCVKQGTEPDTTGAIAGGVTAVLIVLIIAFVVLFIIAKRRGLIGGKPQRETTQRNPATAGHDNEGFDGEELKSRSRPVSTSQFKEHVEKYHRDSDLLFSDEYKLIKFLSPRFGCNEAIHEANRCKNRFTNIHPFDHSRVKLLPIDDDEGSDYINANYMPGYRSKREFIAAQGPLPATKDDFWRMIWEQNVTLVVMVTQCVERGRIKCEQYWPKDTEAEYYGDLVVQMRSESTLSDYTIRILDVQLGEFSRVLKQFHFTKWPDHGCPESTTLLINFVQNVRMHISHRPNRGPILVHCSAGVGRTGTFIAVDRLLQHIREHNEVDIFGLVLEMRENRCNMVQTEDQYIYIHECIKDAIAQGMHLNNGNLEDQL